MYKYVNMRKLTFMSKSSTSLEVLTDATLIALETLGSHLRTARERRGDSLKTMAARMGTSIPTLRRMEAGDAKVSIGVYAAALWIFGKSEQLAEILKPGEDEYATMLDVNRASRKRG
ncbi:multiprotein-bridging factor 1 family protein [Rhizobium sp. 2YAF20]|uniref:helix-turn-helix domain-containing protein n=1 Tax=Rhizobium sp. 2YAF20 TaxID=3233027 RepID=UPI003F9E26D4